MKKILTIIVCIGIVGCIIFIIVMLTSPKNNNKNNQTTNNNIEQSKYDQSDPDIKKANVWLNLPKNVDMFWKSDIKGTADYMMTYQYKRGNSVMVDGESVENGAHITSENDGISNKYYYYHHVKDYDWNSYCYFETEGWDKWYMEGNYPASSQSYCFTKPLTILDNYSDNHVTLNIEGVGSVDTVTGTDDDGYTYYYSKDLGLNVKIENSSQAWYLTRFDTNVLEQFPFTIPDIKALEAKENPSTTETTEETTEIEPTPQLVYNGEDGEIMVLDE